MGIGSGGLQMHTHGYILPPDKNFPVRPLIVQKLTRNSGHIWGHVHPHP